MVVNQLAIYTQNDKGNVYNILKILGDNFINIESLNLADTEDFGILRLVTNDNKKAEKVLVEAGYMTTLTDLFSISVKNEPGDLEKVLKKLADQKINIEYIYSYSKDGMTYILVKTDDIEKTKKVL